MKNALLTLLGYVLALSIAAAIMYRDSGRELRILWLTYGAPGDAALRSAVTTPQPRVQRAAAGRLISRAETLDTASASALIAAIGDPDPEIAGYSFGRLQAHPDERAALVAACIPFLQSNDVGQQRRGARAMRRIDPTGAESLAAWFRVLDYDDAEVRYLASDAISQLSPSDVAAVPVLANYSNSKNAYIRKIALRGLADLGPAAVSQAANLATIAQDPEWTVRKPAFAALRNIGAPAVPQITRAWSAQHGDILGDFTRLLGDLGPTAKGAVPTLKAALGGPDSEHRFAAAQAWGSIDPAACAAALRPLLRHADPDIRLDALRGLGCVGPTAGAVAIDDVLKALGDNDPRIRIAAIGAISALGELGVKHQPAIKALVADPDPTVAAAARDTLKAFEMMSH